MSSSTCGRSVRFAFGVKRLALVSRSRCASSRMRTSTSFASALPNWLKYLNCDWPARAADDAAHVLGERLAAGGVHGVVAALRELADEVERDDRLAGARPALDEDDRLLRIVVAIAGLRQDRFERDALLVEEHELAVRLDHRRGVLEQLAARPVLRLEHARHDRRRPRRRQVVVQELGQLVGLVAGEERVAVERLGVAIGPQLADRVELVVVEVADGGQRRPHRSRRRPRGCRAATAGSRRPGPMGGGRAGPACRRTARRSCRRSTDRCCRRSTA